MVSVPTADAPPGRRVPLFVSVPPVTSTVPLPAITPSFVNPLDRSSVAPLAIWIVPVCVNVGVVIFIVPAFTFAAPLLLNDTMPMLGPPGVFQLIVPALLNALLPTASLSIAVLAPVV